MAKWPPRKGIKLAPGEHPPGGRCMPGRCYCTKCSDYVPIRHETTEPETP